MRPLATPSATVPLGFHQIGVTLEPEAPIDLLSHDAKRAARRKPEPCEQLVEEAFKPKAPDLRIKLGDLDQKRRKFLRLRLAQHRRRLWRRLLRLWLSKAAEEAGIKQLGNFELHARKESVQPVNFGAAQGIALAAPVRDRLPNDRDEISFVKSDRRRSRVAVKSWTIAGRLLPGIHSSPMPAWAAASGNAVRVFPLPGRKS
jgi:hypothetical protein